MKHIKFTVFAFLAIISTLFSLVSCGGGSGDDGDDFTSSSQNGSSSTAEYSSLVSSYAHASYTYKDFYVNITINSTISSHISGKTIKYGLEFGYNNDLCWEMSCQDFSGGTGTMSCPIFFASDNYDFRTADIYAGRYLQLKAKIDAGETLDKDEKSLFNTLKGYMANESTAKSAYRGKVFAEIDGTRYYFKTITF